MLEVDYPRDLKAHVGARLGTSDWLLIDQKLIDRFADVTGDRQWIHVDVARAKAEMPEGRTLAHGYLLLSLLPTFTPGLLRIRHRKSALNYGLNRVRFTSPVQVDSRVRVTQTLKSVTVEAARTQAIFESVMELEGAPRPAMIAETVTLFLE